MPLFTYQAYDRAGGAVTGKLEADHASTAAARLRKMGYTVVDLAEVKQSQIKKAFEMRRKVTLGELSFFSRQLSTMLAAGIPLTRCLYTLHEQATNPVLRRVTGEVARNVESGASFSESLLAYPDVFSSMYVDMIKAGEIGGSLEEMLKRLSEQLERDKRLRDHIRSATFYPVVIVLFATCVVLAMMFFIVPVFMNFFPPGITMPLPTRIIIAFSDSLRNFWYVYLLFLVLLATGLKLYAASAPGKRVWDYIKFKLPVFGELFKKAAIARFCRTLSTLLAGGIPVLQALDAAGPASGSIQVAGAVKQAGVGIQEGQSIALPLQRSGFFPPMVTNMVAVGEESGDLPALLAKVAEFYEEEVSTMTKGLTALIEPVLIIFVGLIIGGIVIAVYLPIFNVVTTVGR